MSNALSEELQNSYALAAEQLRLYDWSETAPNLLFQNLTASRAQQIRDALYALAVQRDFAVVTLDERDLDVCRVQSRALYREINEAPTPTVLLIENYGALCGEAREFVCSIVKNRLYPITNLWEPTVMEHLLFTVALAAGEAYGADLSDSERAAFRMLDAQQL